MEIVYAKRSCKTGRALREEIPYDLEDEDILINLGNSNLNEDDYYDYDIINSVEAIRNCVDKRRCFELLKENGVPFIPYLNYQDRFRVKRPMKVVLRKGKRLTITDNLNEIHNSHYDYMTRFEDKLKEYRVIIFKDKILRISEKVNYDGQDIWKQENSNFVTKRLSEVDRVVKDVCKNGAKAVGIDLCGIDVIVNRNREVKILEINSGMGLSEYSRQKLFDAVMDYFL